MNTTSSSNRLPDWPKQKLRGHRIPGYRYTSREFMEEEFEQMWSKVWLLLGRESEMPTSVSAFQFKK